METIEHNFPIRDYSITWKDKKETIYSINSLNTLPYAMRVACSNVLATRVFRIAKKKAFAILGSSTLIRSKSLGTFSGLEKRRKGRVNFIAYKTIEI